MTARHQVRGALATETAVAKGSLVFNVKDYGAAGDGVTDDITAITAAIAAVPSQGGIVYFPPGTYLTSDPVAPKSNLVMRGAGRSASRILQNDPNKDGIRNVATGLAYITIEDLDVRCSAATGTGIGINLGANTAASAYLSVHRVNVQGFGGTGLYLGRWIASSVSDVRSQGNGGHGFHLDKGTSIAVSGTYALNCLQSGYRLSGGPMNYTVLSATATDGCGIGYDLDAVQGVTLMGCGNESGVNRSGSYPGTGIKITGGAGIGIHNHFTYDNTEVGIYVTGSATNVLITGYRDNTPHAGASFAIKTDAGTKVVIIDPKLDGTTSYATNTVVALNHGSRSEMVGSGSAAVLRGTTATGGASNTQPVFHAVGNDVLNRAIGAQAGADANLRWLVDIAGKTEWGPGNASRDTNLYRSAAGVLATDGELIASNLAVTGLTGAVNPGRFVGVTASGAPSTGTFAVGDFIVTQNGQMFVCVVAGTPGTWTNPRDLTQALVTGEESLPRPEINSTAISLASGTMRLAYFTARKTETTTQVKVWSGGTAAAATPTVCRIGLYAIASDGSGTLVASTANDTALFAGITTAYTKSWSASYAKQAGQRYALGVLVVSAQTMPTLSGHSASIATEMLVAPAMAATVAGLSDLPGSVSASPATGSGRPYAAVLP